MEMKTFGHAEPGVHYIRREGVYGVAYNNKGEVAIVEVPYGHMIPGGGIEDGEDHITCLKREFLEETGYDISVGDYIDCFEQYTYSPKSKRFLKLVGHFYHVELKAHIGGQQDSDHELIWMAAEEAFDRMNLEYQAHVIRQIAV